MISSELANILNLCFKTYLFSIFKEQCPTSRIQPKVVRISLWLQVCHLVLLYFQTWHPMQLLNCYRTKRCWWHRSQQYLQIQQLKMLKIKRKISFHFGLSLLWLYRIWLWQSTVASILQSTILSEGHFPTRVSNKKIRKERIETF